MTGTARQKKAARRQLVELARAMGVESSDAQRKGAVLHLNRGNSRESRGNYGYIRGLLRKFTRSHLHQK